MCVRLCRSYRGRWVSSRLKDNFLRSRWGELSVDTFVAILHEGTVGLHAVPAGGHRTAVSSRLAVHAPRERSKVLLVRTRWARWRWSTVLHVVLRPRSSWTRSVTEERRTPSMTKVAHRDVVTGVTHELVRRRSTVHWRHAVEVTAVNNGWVIVASVVSSSAVMVVSFSLNLGLNALAVRCVANHRQDWADSLDQLSTLRRLGVVKSGLDDVIGERVTQETLETLLVEQLVDDRTTSSRIGDTDALLDNVRRELLCRQSRDVTEELTNDRLDEPVVVQIENILHDIVAERILDKRERVVGNLGDELDTLRLGSVVNAALKHAATVTVGGNFDTVRGDSVIDELVVLRRQVVQALLNDVVAVQVLDQSHDIEVESQNQTLHLTLS